MAGGLNNAGLEAIKYQRGKLDVLDQLKLPHEFVYDNITSCEEAFDCIKSMRVRGAPAIAIVAALALAVELSGSEDKSTSVDELYTYICNRLDYLMGSRPTAVDLSNAIKLLKRTSRLAVESSKSDKQEISCAEIRAACISCAEKILEDDLTTNLAIGRYGAEYLRSLQQAHSAPIDEADALRFFTTSPPGTQGLPDRAYRKLSVLTHCNTGSLATSGHGTALGIIRSLYRMNYLDHAFCTETRPYNQGSRLTAFELVYEQIPSTLITDSMAGALFARKKEERNICAVIVGADRVARNGDTANKIGTYSLAILAREHGIKFIVAAPTTSIDIDTATGASIRIEDRDGMEMTQVSGATVSATGQVDVAKAARVAIADQRINVWNPAFDVTPAKYIDAIITERGEILRDSSGNFSFAAIMPGRFRAVGGGVLGAGADVNGAGQGKNERWEANGGAPKSLSDEMQFQMDPVQ